MTKLSGVSKPGFCDGKEFFKFKNQEVPKDIKMNIQSRIFDIQGTHWASVGGRCWSGRGGESSCSLILFSTFPWSLLFPLWKGGFQNYLAGVPTHSAKLFWAEWFSTSRGGRGGEESSCSLIFFSTLSSSSSSSCSLFSTLPSLTLCFLP